MDDWAGATSAIRPYQPAVQTFDGEVLVGMTSIGE